ncbi:MAG: GHKL domain-containing protein [Lachnospiraceae bacterium]|nr:GHKL domain-containing protein [Lachnospiraceae bacterium]
MTPPLLFTVALLLIFYWFLFQETVLRKKDNEYQKTVQIQQLQYQSISREIESARRNSHDMKHYLQGMYELLEQGQVEEVKERLTQVVERVDHRENENYCENPAVNVLLQYYAGLARDEDIRFEAKVECGELPIPNMELTTLFGNILDNAIYSCRQVKKEPRIDVKIGMIGDSLLVLVTNSCEKVYPSGLYRMDADFVPAEAFVSGKQGGGFGLKSITMTVQKYRGEAGFQFDEKAQKFTTRIRMNLHPKML